MLRVKALGPCTLSGFRTLLRGDVCDVPVERRDQVERLRIAGRVELLDVPVAAEPSGKEAPADVVDSPAPAALSEEELELARLQAELDKLEGKGPEAEQPAPPAEPAKPKRAPMVCVHCGEVFQKHAQGKPPTNAEGCVGLKALFKPKKAEPAAS